MFSRIMYVTVFVGDQDKALEFYTSHLGFQKRADYAGPEGRFLTVALKDQGFEVILWPGSTGRAKTTPGMGKKATLLNIGGEGSPRYQVVEEKGVHEDDPGAYDKRKVTALLAPGETKLPETGIGDDDLHHM